MKKFNLLVALSALVLGGMFFTACEDTTGTGPEIAFLNGDNSVTLETGVTTYTIAGTITSDAGLESVRFSKVTTGGSTQLQLIESFTDKNNYQFQYELTNITENMTIEVQATDKDAVQNSANFTVNVTVGGAINTVTSTLGGGGNTTIGSFFASTGTTHVYKQTPATSSSSLIDIIYHYTSGAELFAPSNATIQDLYSLSFATYNATKFKTTSLTTAQFDAVDDDVAIVTAADGASATMLNVAANDVVAFVTAAGKKGLLKVVAVTGNNTGTIDIVVKVQQ
jgi:hypothetical protein